VRVFEPTIQSAPFKVFGVGLGKTGTCTLSWMLSSLGWRVAHFLGDPRRYDEFDAVTDSPTHLYLMSSDVRFPGSRFILTERPLSSWLDSLKQWMKTHPVDGSTSFVRLTCYGELFFDEDRARKMYERHLRFVEWYMKEYIDSDRFLRISLCDPNIPDEAKWSRLCKFLGVATPELTIGKINSQSYAPKEHHAVHETKR